MQISPYMVPGTRHDMDANVFFGTPEQLRARWPLTTAVTERTEYR